MIALFSLFKDREFFKSFFKIALPVMLHALILFVVNFVDNIMVGSISNEAISGVYAANQATYILMIAAYGVIMGAGVYIQQFSGANDQKHLQEAFRYKILVMTLFIIIVTIIYYTLGHNLVWFYCHSDENAEAIYNEGMGYFYIMVLSYIPYCISMIYTTTIREIGKTKYALIAGGIAFACNVILNAILIYGFHLGTKGAAIGTVVARIIELFVIIVICYRKKFTFCSKALRKFHINKKLFVDISKKSILFLGNELLWVFGMTFLSLSYAQRSGVLSALSVVNSMSNVFNIIFQGLSIGIGVLVGGYLGKGEFENAKKYTKNLYWLALLFSLSFGIIIVILSPVIPNVFAEMVAEQKSLATTLLMIYGGLLWANCLYCCSYMTLKTGGKALVTFCLDSGLIWLISVPLAWILVRYTSLSLVAIFAIVTSVDIFKLFIGFCYVKQGGWLNNLTQKEKESYA